MHPNRFLAVSAALAALVTVALLFMWRSLLLGEVFLPLDALMHMHPWRYSYERVPVNNQLTADAIRQIYPRRLLTNQIIFQGAWPLWNPSILSGTPLLDDGQIALFYPPSLIFLLAPLGQAFGLYAFAQLVLAGVGTFLLARGLGLGNGAAALAGAAYMINGHMLNYLQLPELSAGTAVAPWCLWIVDRACKQGRLSAWGWASLILALPLVTQLQLGFYTYIGVGLLTLYNAARLRDWRPLLGLLCAVILAIGLAAVQLLPAAALAAQGQRSDVGFRVPEGDNLFGLILRLVFPAAGGFERVGGAPSWGPVTIQIPYPYIGIAPLLLAGIGLLISKRRAAWFWGALALLAFIGAARGPIIPLLNALIPVHRQFDDHTRWLMLWSLALAILAAMGAEALVRWRSASSGVRSQESGVRMAGRSAGILTQSKKLNQNEQRSRTPILGFRFSVLSLSAIGYRLSAILLAPARLLLFGTLASLGLWSLFFLQPLLPGSRIGIYQTLLRQQPLLPTGLALTGTLICIGLLLWRRVPVWLAWGLLIAVLAIDVHWFNSGYNTSTPLTIGRPTTDLTRDLAGFPAGLEQEHTIYPPTRTIAFLQTQPGPFRIYGLEYEALSPNLAGAFGLEDVRGYHSLYPERYNRLARLIDGKDYGHTSDGMASLRVYITSGYARRRVLDMLNAEFFLANPGSTIAERFSGLELVFEGDEGRIYRNTQAMPRAWLVHRAEVIPNDDAQLDALARPDFDPAQIAIVEGPVPNLSAPATAEPIPQVTYAPNRVSIRATASTPALLVLADSYYDGWEAEVDGQPTHVYRANYALRGVFLATGEHTIVFNYRPKPFLYGGIISLITLAGLGVWLGRRSALSRRRIMEIDN